MNGFAALGGSVPPKGLSLRRGTRADRRVCADRLDNAKAALALACNHYHIAREQDALVYDRLLHVETRDLGTGSIERNGENSLMREPD
jgi:hypothetical protein